ncbi:polysaccharide deacetylase family protein [Caulobacter sp. DWR2-3-1b2]|uniref:polysaccharide deacetylase family protein n=1 Tax=unclassified Caulobacter TaxID=2648921 RepID=UPI003CE7ECC0
MLPNRLLIAVILGPELARWKAGGHGPLVWWRDDDARQPGPALDRLLALSRRFDAPITLAAVPDGDIPALSKTCRETPCVELAIHGFRHENRAPPGQPSGEVNELDLLTDVIQELGEAIEVFRRAGVRASLFVPPWNNAHPTLKTALRLRGLTLSCYGEMRDEHEPTARLDTHLDIMRWKPRARFRGAVRFLLRTRRHLAERRLKTLWDEPVGLLTHHLDHDEAAWHFLEALLPVVKPVSRRSLAGGPVGMGALASATTPSLKVG